jgi:thiamine kinase-like enzyme
MGCAPEGLWEVGTYWHLATRPDELRALDDSKLKKAAAEIDARLSKASFKTLVHGDAKLANFCFSDNGGEVAAVDFQYVGGGCGMKDVAYFIGSCLDEQACEAKEEELLDCYFNYLREALGERQKPVDPNEVISEWRRLYHLAWADFHRFLKGWCPGHWKINGYSERICREVYSQIL